MTLTERILPERGAARKATASITEQLSDSPGHSEADSPSSSNPFREPAHRTTSVKYRYTATGKHLSSPLKASPERKSGKPKKSKLASLTPAPHVRNPPVATTSRKRKAPLRKEQDILNALLMSTPSPLSSAPTSPISPTIDLPSSPTLTTLPNPPKRLSISKTSSLHGLGNTASSSSFHLSSKRKSKKTKPSAQNDAAHPWDIGDSVWVRVTRSGVLTDNDAASESLVWWPAQVVQKQPLRVSMFGEFPSSSSTSRGLCTIFAPSSSNVQSINDDSGIKRFSSTTFLTLSLDTDGDAGPPTKKPRLDDTASLEARWESAVQRMDKASTLEQEGLPALLSTYATAGDGFGDSLDDSDPEHGTSHKRTGTTTSKKSKQTESAKKSKPRRSKQEPKEDSPFRGSPCPPDPTLLIPGELILAMAPKTGSSYWPAMILAHSPDVQEKYTVKFLDDEQHTITRDMFFTSDERGFVQCTLGQWESAINTMDDPESEDEDGEFSISDANDQDPDDGALPPPAGNFEDLSVRAQVAYVKPILRAILNKDYAPAREKHDAFMRGGSGRAALLKSAGVRGRMDARFVKAVQKVLCQWVVGDSGMRPQKLDTGDVLPASGEAEGASVNATSLDVRPAETMPCDSVPDDKMDGIESATVTDDAPTDQHGTVPLTTDVAEMVVEGPAPLPPSTNGVTLSPSDKQALAPKSQLDLLAEVSQAVATEPSLLHSHSQLPGLKTLLDMTRKDTSAQSSPLSSIPEEEQRLPPRTRLPAACPEFEALSGVEKLDYCLSVLLPESIQQLLLWRSGDRTSAALLSPEEEQKLHKLGERKAAETDWVDDVMRLRAAQARLRGVVGEKKKVEIVQGGTRSRPRRSTVSRP